MRCLRLLRYSSSLLFVLLISILVMAQSRRAPLSSQTHALAVDREQHSAWQASDEAQYARRRAKTSTAQLNPSQAVASNFAPAVTYDSGGFGAVSLAVADVNGDGKSDLIVTNSASFISNIGVVGVLLGKGDGTFQSAVTYNAGGWEIGAMAVADVNGDGNLDVVVASQCVSSSNCNTGAVSVLLGNGDGTFRTPVTYSSGGYGAVGVAVADVNGDGKPDLLVANACPSGNGCLAETLVGVLLGNGDGTFQPAVTYASGGSQATSIAVADVNGDGKPDLVVSHCLGGGYFCNNVPSVVLDGVVGVLLGNGDGTFQPAVTYNSGGQSTSSIAVADVNADGVPDILFANECGQEPQCGGDGTLGVLLGNGDGTFTGPNIYDTGGFTATSIAIADMNSDGKPDLVAVNALASTVAVLLGNGDGTFQAAANYGTGGIVPSNPGYSVAAKDVNGDGKPDLLVVNASGTNAKSTVGVLINLGYFATAVPSPTNVTFPGQYVGTTGPAQTVTVTNTGNTALTISKVTASAADFTTSSKCTNSVMPGMNCTIGVSFDPTTSGARNGTLTITDNGVGSPQMVTLSGAGQDFSMASSGSSSETVSPGQTANYTITIAPSGGFNQSVSFACSGAPTPSTCSVSPNPVSLNGSASTTVKVAVSTVGNSASLARPFGLRPIGSRFAFWLSLSGLPAIALIGLCGGARRRRSRALYVSALLCLLYAGITLSACGSGGPSGSGGGGTPAGTYNPTVTGTFTAGSTTLNHKTKFTLVVQ